MSLGLYSYSAAYPVLGALRARSLRESVVETMLGAGSFGDCVEALSRALGSEPPSDVPGEVDSWLWGEWEKQGKELARFMRGHSGRFLEFSVAKSDIRKLKFKVRQIRTRQGPSTETRSRPPVLMKERKLEDARTLDSLLRAISGTRLEGVLRRALPALSGGESLLPFDLAIEVGYERALAKELDSLGWEGRRVRSGLFDDIWGLRDFVKALRLRFGYGMEPQEVFHYVAFSTNEFGETQFWRVMQGESPGECVDLLPKGRLSETLASIGGSRMPLNDLEVAVRKHALRAAGVRRPGSPFALLTFVKYLIRQEVLTEDAVTVLAAKRLAMAENEVRPLLSIATGE